MPTLADIRKKYPQYNDLSDKELAEGFHRKFYSDLPFDEFATKVGYEEPGVLGTLAEIPKGLGAGAAGLLESAAIGASAIFPEEQERAARAKIQELAAPVREALAPAQGYEEGMVRKGAEALGSTLPFFALGPLGVAGRVAGAGLGMGAGAGEARTRAEQGGATEGAGAVATGLGAIIGMSEMYAPGVSHAITGTIKKALVAGGLEGAQEAATQAAQNLVAKGLYDPNQPILIGTGEAGAYGAGVGALSEALIDFALGRRVHGAVTGAPEKKSQEPTQLPLPGIPAAETAAPPAGQLELPMEMPEAARPEVSEAQMDLFGGKTTTAPAPEPIQEEMQFDQFPIPEPIKPVTPVEPIAEPTIRKAAEPATPETLDTKIPTDKKGLQAFGKAFNIGFTAKILREDGPLAGKNIADPAQAAEVRQILEGYASGKPAEGASAKITSYLSRPEFRSIPAEVVTGTSEPSIPPAGVEAGVRGDTARVGEPVSGPVAAAEAPAGPVVGRTESVSGALVTEPVVEAAPAPVAPQGVQAVEALRRRLNKSASDAFENDLINESQYNAARDELKRSGFSEERVRKILSGEIKPRRTRTQLAPAGAGIPKVEAQKVVADLTQGWTNSPTINVVESVEELPESVRASATPESRGLYDPETRTVHILAQNAESPESVKGTVFHESLGHFGLAEQFDAQLDDVMAGIYDTNSAAKKAADDWMKANPAAYGDLAPNIQKARAVEEVLAERSEAGPIKEPGLRAAYNRVANFIRNVGRKIGIVKTYSDNDVNQILRQAHGRVKAVPRKTTGVKGVRLQRGASPAPQDTFYNKAIDNVMGAVESLPEPTQKVVDGTLSALSKMGSAAKKGWIALQSFYHLEDAYGKVMPIAPLVRHIEKRASETSKLMATDTRKLAEYSQVVNGKYPKLAKAWNNLADEVTLFQVGPWEADSKKLVGDVQNGARTQDSLTPYEKKQYAMTKEFLAMPKELQDTMRSLYADYAARGDAAIQASFKFLPPSVREKFQKQFDETRLKYWAPLRRKGAYILKYIDNNGDYRSEHYESEYLRKRAMREAQRLGGKDFLSTMNIREARTRGAPPTGFTADILKAVEESFPANATDEFKQTVLDNVYETYMDYIPAESLKQSTRGRAKFEVEGLTQFGVKRVNPDVLGTYEKYMAQSAYQLKNLEYAPLMDEALSNLREKANELKDAPPEGMSSEDITEVLGSIEGRVKFSNNPTYAGFVTTAAKMNYIFSIAGNVSTAVFNTTSLPTMALSELMGKYKGRAPAALTSAIKIYAKSKRGPDGTLIITAKDKWEYPELFRVLDERGITGIAAEQELRQAQNIRLSGYEAMSDKVNYYAAYMFRTTERFNREVTAIAAFRLARESGESVEKAIEYAVDVNNRVNGPTLPELQSRLYQNDIGRIMLTFKTFVLNQMINIAKTFHEALKGESKQVKDAARLKLLGIYGTTYMLAGIKGMPFFGAAEILANLLMGDDDEPYDVQQLILEATGTVGLDGPVSKMLNIATASRTGYYDTLWRDDPKRLAEVGLPTFVLEKSLGPTWGLMLNYERGLEELGAGRLDRAAEAFTPAAARNVLKSLRYATEGVLDKNGNPIADDVSAWNNFMQVFGFAPADLSVIQAQRGAKYEVDKKLASRRSALLTQHYAAMMAGDPEAVVEVNQAILKFNETNPNIAIGADSFKRSAAQRKKQRELALSGSYLPQKRALAASKYVTMTEEEQEELED